MTTFQRLTRKKNKCDICGGPMWPMYGCGWDNDRIVCADILDCGAEIIFPTSTPPIEEKNKEPKK